MMMVEENNFCVTSLKASVILPIATDLYMCGPPSFMLVYPDKADGQNEVPFGRDTGVVPWSPRLSQPDEGSGLPTGKGDLELEPQSKFALQFVAKPLWIAEWLL